MNILKYKMLADFLKDFIDLGIMDFKLSSPRGLQSTPSITSDKPLISLVVPYILEHDLQYEVEVFFDKRERIEIISINLSDQEVIKITAMDVNNTHHDFQMTFGTKESAKYADYLTRLDAEVDSFFGCLCL